MDRDATELDARARAECPGLDLDESAWRSFLVSRLASAATPIACPGDLRLAFACAAGDPGALQLYEQRFAAMLDDAIAGVGMQGASSAEVVQELRCRLLVSDGSDPPRILKYRGDGPLGGWLRVAALRLAVDFRRRTHRERGLEDAFVPEAARSASFGTRHDAAILRTAIRAAIVGLDAEARAILRYHYADRVGVEELGRIYRVHASTMSRRLAQARARILEAVRAELGDSLGPVHDVEVSIEELLRTPTA